MLTPIISFEEPSLDTIKYVLNNTNKILDLYRSLIDSYVLDFFTYSHWNKLPSTWRLFFSNVTSEDLHMLLNFNVKSSSKHQVMPLELICLRNLINHLSIPRNNLNNSMEDTDLFCNMLQKPDQPIFKTASTTKCPYVVDVGSGLGHLDRLLAFGYGLKVCGIERNEKLTVQARHLDGLFMRQARAYDQHFLQSKQVPVHINYSVSLGTNVIDFSHIVKEAFAKDAPFGIVGLHPCGDLGPALLRLYQECDNIKFITIVGCCYMKLTSESETTSNFCGYPLSQFSLENKFHLSYNAREVACHALESYIERLKRNEHWQLKIHCYRAALEYLIVQHYPECRHTALANVKYESKMSFSEYCSKAVKHVRVNLSEEEINSETIKGFLSEWKAVLVFYSVRLLFAPLIESSILLDRYLYLHENTRGNCSLVTAFDPLISPRNHILMGRKEIDS